MANVTNIQKVDNLNKTITTVSQSTNPSKSEPTHIIVNGPLVTSSTGTHVSLPSNGQMVQRVPVKRITLPVQKHQMMTNIQAQIEAIMSRKSTTPADQTVLTKLQQERAKIIAAGKVIDLNSINSVSKNVK